mgnify:FL=1
MIIVSMCTTQSYLDLLPDEILDNIYLCVHRLCQGSVIDEFRELCALCKGKGEEPLFTTLIYEGFRPFNSAQYSGARDIAVYIGDCWEPYLYDSSDDESSYPDFDDWDWEVDLDWAEA